MGYRCAGWGSDYGPCGASDCEWCHPEGLREPTDAELAELDAQDHGNVLLTDEDMEDIFQELGVLGRPEREENKHVLRTEAAVVRQDGAPRSGEVPNSGCSGGCPENRECTCVREVCCAWPETE